MKAAVYRTYGPPDVVHIEEVEKPVPKDNQVLLRVRAASVNPMDRHLMKGKPFIARLAFGLRRPRRTRPGADVAGVVETVGGCVTRFKPGDAVFGMCMGGAFAEYICVSENVLAKKPDNVTFEQAASAPVAAFTALQGLRDKGHIQPGQKVLVNGAAGGVGTFAVQVAKAFGAEVTAVCSTKNLEMMRSLGTDHVVDYTKEDFTKGAQRYDLIFDLVGNHPLSAYRRVLTPDGKVLMAGVLAGHGLFVILMRFIQAIILSRLEKHKFISFIAKFSQQDLVAIGDLLAEGKLTPFVEKRYPLSDVPEALRLIDTGHARGKVIITVA